jgi:hypothetical protein
MLPRVIGKLCNGEESTPVILSNVCKASEVSFNPLVHIFALSICLGVKCCAEILVDASGFTNGFGEVPSKSGVMIGDDTFGGSK